jgi:transposase
MPCGRCPSEAVRLNLRNTNWRRFVPLCCKTPPNTDLALNCGLSSVWERSSNACTAFALARHRFGGSWARWALARKSPRSVPSSATRMPCAAGSDVPGRPLKKAQREGRLIVFVDESGISERPTRVRTWAPKGQTPIIQFHFNWNHVSVIAGLTRTNCLFRLHEGSIRKEEIVEFLKALNAHLKQPLLVIWDGLKAHRSRLVREYLDRLDGHIQIAFLPPYAPDMNPVEYLWAWLKRHALANYCPNDLGELHASARNKLKSAQKRPSIIAACWMQATLW